MRHEGGDRHAADALNARGDGEQPQIRFDWVRRPRYRSDPHQRGGGEHLAKQLVKEEQTRQLEMTYG